MTRKKLLSYLRNFFLFLCAVQGSLLPAFGAALVTGTLEALDSAGAPRSPAIFNNSERIGFSYSVTNTLSKTGFIQFSFALTDPQGRAIFSQQGNAVSSEQVGQCGASISGIAVAQFYSIPGNYELKGTAVFSDGSESISAALQIQIFSPLLNLSYPPNGAQNIADQPVIFRWIGTGATKYKISIADNPALFNPLLTSDVFETQFLYPTNPSDSRQRMASGQVYYWSVQGQDTMGTKTSEAAYPYSFTVAGGAGQAQSKDLSLASIEPSAMPSPGPGQLLIDVAVKNNGGRPESGVAVSVFVQGISQGKQTLDSINVAEEKKLIFTVYPPKAKNSPTFMVSATLEGFFDDNLMNNSLSKAFPWPEGGADTGDKAKILGSVWLDSGDGKKKFLEGAVVSYKGPLKGRVTTNRGGEYVIESLTPGDYTLTASHQDYPESEPLAVSVVEIKAYANRDLKFVTGGAKSKSDKDTKEGKEEKAKKEREDKAKVKEAVMKVVPAKVAKEFEGYQLQSIEAPGLSESQVNEILAGLADGTMKILSATAE